MRTERQKRPTMEDERVINKARPNKYEISMFTLH